MSIEWTATPGFSGYGHRSNLPPPWVQSARTDARPTLKGQRLLARLCVPDLDRAVITATGDPLAVRAESQAVDCFGVPFEREHL